MIENGSDDIISTQINMVNADTLIPPNLTFNSKQY